MPYMGKITEQIVIIQYKDSRISQTINNCFILSSDPFLTNTFQLLVWTDKFKFMFCVFASILKDVKIEEYELW